MKYMIIHRAFTDPPEPGMVDKVPDDVLGTSNSALDILEWVFHRHNQDDRPDRWLRPSLSSNMLGDGDIVILFDEIGDRGYSCWECNPQGWKLFPTTDWPTSLFNDFIRQVEAVQQSC